MMRSILFLIATGCFTTSATLGADSSGGTNAPVATEHAANSGPLVSEQEFWSALDLDFPGLERVKTAVAQGDFPLAAEAYLDFRRTKSRARYSIDPKSKPAKAEATSDPSGEKVLQHILVDNNYGFQKGEVPLGENIDWTYNPVSPDDPKYTTEFQWCLLNRSHMWETLAKAYWKTLDDRYVREYVAQLRDWVHDCPVVSVDTGKSISWRGIEAGIRMYSTWPPTYFRVLDSPAFTPDANQLYATSCLEHARHLAKITLENPKRSGNHVVMENNGLATVGFLFPEFKEARHFRDVALDRMTRELTRQVYPDGMQIELTFSYHNVTLDNFMDLAELAKLNDFPLPALYDSTMKAMYLAETRMMDQNGLLPFFNDCTHDIYASKTCRKALKRWKDPRFEFAVSLGQKGDRKGKAPPLSDALEYAGYYVMRSDWSPRGLYAVFDGGPAGSGHYHEDKLHFVLSGFGKPLVTDPSNYAYDKSKFRNYVLITRSHNTITVDGKDQHRGNNSGVAEIKKTGNPWLVSPLFDYVSATYDSGYQQSEYIEQQYMPLRYVGERDKSVTHTRHFIFLKPSYFVAVDFLEGSGTHRFDAFFQLDAPDATVDEAQKSVRSARTDGAQVELFPLDLDGLEVRKVQGQTEPQLLGWIPRQNRPIPTIVYTKQQAAPASFGTVLFPYETTPPTLSGEPFLQDQPGVWARRISSDAEQTEIAIRRGANAMQLDSILTEPLSTDAKLAITRKPRNGPSAWTGIWKATRLSGAACELTLEKAGALILQIAGDSVVVFNPQKEPARVTFKKPFRKEVKVAPGVWTRISAKETKSILPPPELHF